MARFPVLCLLYAVDASASWIGRLFGAPQADVLVQPKVIDSSHNLRGYEAEKAVDGNDQTFWLVPGGQRMEMMSSDKWLVFDLGSERVVDALRLRGKASMFAPAHVLLDAAPTANGPWQQVSSFRGLGSLEWQRVDLSTSRPISRFFRLYMRREGHATFRHAVHGVQFECAEER